MSEDTQLFLAPCANRESQTHFEKTVQRGIEKETYESVTEYHLGNQAAVWGVSQGNRGSWNKINKGDVILFYFGDWEYKYSAIVEEKEINQELADLIWDIDDFHKTWGLLIYLNEVSEISIDSRELHKFADYERMYPYHFMPFREKGTRKIIKEYGSVNEYIENNKVKH